MQCGLKKTTPVGFVQQGSRFGIVVIGRNEGERLSRCLQSMRNTAAAVVYVDSGSTDGSGELAQRLGAVVVELDLRQPFTAARARNMGLARLLHLQPDLRYVQFIDGDCEAAEGWLQFAGATLDDNECVAAVCGRRREVHPNASIYNRLCDLEWDTPVGETRSCGGDAMFRIDAFQQLGGYNEAVIAGEEPELCFRLRQAGWKIRRLDAEMTRHDAAMSRFGQWWKRSVRGGHAYAEAADRHGWSSERFCVKPTISIWLWAAVLPLIVVASLPLTGGFSLLLFLLYLLQIARVARSFQSRGWSREDRWFYALFCMLAKWPQLQGQCRYLRNRLRGRHSTIIEYKGVAMNDSAVPS